jgi:uncharacterized protein YabE (DUF348 family)
MEVRPTRLRRLRLRRAAQATAFAVVTIAILGGVAVAASKTITLIVGGRSEAISTTSSSVHDLLRVQGLTGAPGLWVQPPPSTSLADGMTVVVSPTPGSDLMWEPAGTADVGVWVVERTGSRLFGKAAAASDEASVSVPGVGQSPVVSVRVVVSGKVHDVTSNAGTAGELLSAMGIQPDADDRVSPPPDTPLPEIRQVRFDRVDVRARVVRRALPFDVETDFSPELVPGTWRVIDRGIEGQRLSTEIVTLVNGRVEDRVVLASWITRRPIEERRLSGPAPADGGSVVGPGGERGAQAGVATWYDPPWSGLSAAHPWLPFGTYVTVTDEATGRSVTVVVNDRGPFSPGRIVDLSPEAFERLAPLGRGILDVRLTW